MDDDLAALRVEYGASEMSQAAAGNDPMQLFRAWFADARQRRNVVEPNAMSLATATSDGMPSVRMVLLKDVDVAAASFTWYTNLASRKAREIMERAAPVAALAWWWPGDDASVPGRQVRAVGRVELVDRATARTYFDSRPMEARVGAAASRQSRPVRHRSELEARVAQVAAGTVELPESWGGMRLLADELEFWQGRAGRLHDRVVFLRADAADTVPAEATCVTDGAGTTWHRMRLEP